MKHVPLSALEGKIIRPGFDEHLKPLLMYRGALTLGRAHRLWNLLVAAMEHEASRADVSQRLQHKADFSHLCGPDKPVQSITLETFASRLRDNPQVLGEMPHLGEYLDWAFPRQFALTRVSADTRRSRNMGAGDWREFVDRRSKSWRAANGRGPKPKLKKPVVERLDLVYPFLIHDGGKPEHILLRKVNAAVSMSLPPHMRADACQDLIVGILSGEFDPDNLTLPAKEMQTRISRFCQNKFAEVSLDSYLPGTDIPLMDTFSTEDSIWARI